jgi:hypothetical protein
VYVVDDVSCAINAVFVIKKQLNVAGADGLPAGKKFAVNEASYTPFARDGIVKKTWPVPPVDAVV